MNDVKWDPDKKNHVKSEIVHAIQVRKMICSVIDATTKFVENKVNK